MCDDNNEDAVRQLRRQVSELTKEVAYLKDALHRDKTGLAHALGAVRVLVRGYGWLSQNGVWASYGDEEQTEKTLRDEMSACLNEVDTVALDALSVSGDLASASKQGKPLALTLPDYANLCQALLDELKRKRQPCNMCEDFEPAERTLGDWGTCQHEDASLLNGAEYTCEKFTARTCSQDNQALRTAIEARDAARADSSLRSAMLLQVGAVLASASIVGAEDTSDPRWTPVLRDAHAAISRAVHLRTQLDEAEQRIAILEQLTNPEAYLR